jgi:hypothetical protein
MADINMMASTNGFATTDNDAFSIRKRRRARGFAWNYHLSTGIYSTLLSSSCLLQLDEFTVSGVGVSTMIRNALLTTALTWMNISLPLQDRPLVLPQRR